MKHPSRLRTQKNSLCFLRCLLSKPSGEIITARPKTNPPADFSPAGGNLFNVSSVGLDRDPEGRADHCGQGCRPIASALWMPSLPIGPSALSVRQFQVAPGSITAARTCAASAAGTVRVMREPETLTGIEYSKAGWPVSAGRRSMSNPLNAVPSHNAPT